MAKKKKTAHGGPRPGAGRKPLPADERLVKITIRVRPDELDGIKSKGPVTDYVRQLIRRDLGMDPAT